MPLPFPTPRELFDAFTIRRRAAGSYVGGTFVPGVQSEITIRASVQPARPEDLEDLPEGKRTSAAVRFSTPTLVQTANETAGVLADRLVHEGAEWEVQKVSVRGRRVLPHYEAVATRLERSTP